MTVMTNARFDAAKVDVEKKGICVMVGPEGKEPQELRAEMMLVAAGRAPNVEEIGLETTKVEVDGASSRSTAGCGRRNRTSTRSAMLSAG